MLRKAVEGDLPALVALRRRATGDTEQNASGWLQNVAGLQNLLLLERDGCLSAMLAAVPVRCAQRRGVWFCGAAAQDGVPFDSLLPRLLASCLRAYAAGGYEFAVMTPENAQHAAALTELGFQNLFPLRVLQMPIRRNLMAQAAFDSLTVRRLLEMRARCQPACIALPESAMNEVMTQLYRRGATVVSDRHGYGIYYLVGDTAQFVELQADNDHSADLLLQAVREKTGAEQARILLAENQSLYLGAGRRCGYGMLAFLKEPFSVTDVYFRILL